MANQVQIVTTGGTGLVGSRVIELLKNKYAFFDASLENGIDLLDTAQLELFLTKHPSQYMIHFAAFTDVKAAQQEQGNINGLCYQLNVEVSKYIAQKCHQQNRHLIYISTDYVFDGEKVGKYKEKDLPNPLNWYGQTKYLGERAIIDSGCSFTILRISSPFGIHQHRKPDYVQKILNLLQGNSGVMLFNDQFLTPTFIEDFAKVIEILVYSKPNVNNIYHIVSTEIYTPYDIGLLVKEILSLQTTIKPNSVQSSGNIYPNNCSLDNQKLKHDFNLKLTNLSETIRESVQSKIQ